MPLLGFEKKPQSHDRSNDLSSNTSSRTTYKTARRIVVGMVGTTILLIGIALLVLPGPAFIVIPAGLAVLSLEFAWAQHWLQKIKDKVGKRTGKA